MNETDNPGPDLYATDPIAEGQEAVDALVERGIIAITQDSEDHAEEDNPVPKGEDDLVRKVEAVQIGHQRVQVRVKNRRGGDEWYQIVGEGDHAKIYTDRPRAYRSSALPAISAPMPDAFAAEAVLLKMYETSVDGWRLLTDVRFKLLALLPALSVLAWSQLLPSDELRFGAGVVGGVGIGLLGLVIAVGIMIYDQRNDELYNDLASRCRRIESELGIDTGPFRGRPEPQRLGISHGTGTNLVYWAVVVGWVSVVLWFSLIGLDVVEPESLEPASEAPTSAQNP